MVQAYNSVVATFCHNMARGLPIQVNDPAASVTLVYVDDVLARFVQLLDGADAAPGPDGFATVAPQYTTTLMTEHVGTGLVRALYATYVSYLNKGKQPIRPSIFSSMALSSPLSPSNGLVNWEHDRCAAPAEE